MKVPEEKLEKTFRDIIFFGWDPKAQETKAKLKEITLNYKAFECYPLCRANHVLIFDFPSL